MAPRSSPLACNLQIRRRSVTSPRLRRLIAGAIEEHLDVSHPSVQNRRGTHWLECNELARFDHHRSRKVLPRLKNELRL